MALGFLTSLSELFAERTYEILSRKSENEESREIATQLALFEKNHYERIKKAYELVLKLKEDKVETAKDLKPGGYIFEDKTKARYFFLDLPAEDPKRVVFSRDPPPKK